MIRSKFQGMYWRAHKTATLNSFQSNVSNDLIQSGILIGNPVKWQSAILNKNSDMDQNILKKLSWKNSNQRIGLLLVSDG